MVGAFAPLWREPILMAIFRRTQMAICHLYRHQRLFLGLLCCGERSVRRCHRRDRATDSCPSTGQGCSPGIANDAGPHQLSGADGDPHATTLILELQNYQYYAETMVSTFEQLRALVTPILLTVDAFWVGGSLWRIRRQNPAASGRYDLSGR